MRWRSYIKIQHDKKTTHSMVRTWKIIIELAFWKIKLNSKIWDNLDFKCKQTYNNKLTRLTM
jgi:hypothetical protein